MVSERRHLVLSRCAVTAVFAGSNPVAHPFQSLFTLTRKPTTHGWV